MTSASPVPATLRRPEPPERPERPSAEPRPATPPGRRVPLPRPEPGARASAVLLVLGLLAIGVYYLLPSAGSAQAVVLVGINSVAAACGFVAAARAHGLARLTWLALAAGMSLSTLANGPYYAYPLITGRALPFPSLVDGFWLGTYPCFVLALWALSRQRRGDDHAGNVLDALVIFVGGGTLMWSASLGPALQASGLDPFAKAVSAAYPTMDLVVFAMLVRLLVRARRNGALYLLVVSFIALLTSDLVEAVGLADGWYHVGGPCDGLWMLSYLLLGAAALHPSARSFPDGAPDGADRLSLGRLLFLGAAMAAGPLLLADRPAQAIPIAAATVLCFVLVMVRMVWLNRRLAVARTAVEDKSDELRYQALHDALTALPNRALIMDRIDQLLARTERNGTVGAALFVDLDGFKNVNDTLGHDAGDRLLQSVAARLTATLRKVDTIGRMGGDEFVILVEQGAADAAPELVAERVLDVMRQPFELTGSPLPMAVTTSVGVAVTARQSAVELLRQADVALYQAKAAGKNCYQVFHREMQTSLARRSALDFDLRTALEGQQFFLVYQPIYNLDDLNLVSVEALLRWQHPTLGPLMPDEFIPILEGSGQIVEVGRWVLVEACTQMARWRRQGSTLGISVNVSVRQLERDVIVEHVREALAASGLEPSALTLEVTETALASNVDDTAERLRRLKELGVQLAIDDFGTGYSSLSYLQRFPVDSLKIDRTFTDAITRSPESDALIHTLVQLGRDLGLRTLAEGVEQSGQLAHLRAERVDEVQGFLLARPMDRGAVERLLIGEPSD